MSKIRKRKTATGDIDEPIFPGENLEVHIGYTFVSFYGQNPTQKIRADKDSAVMLEDHC